MVDYQTISIMITAASMVIAATYYLTLRSTNQSRKRDIMFQRIQTLSIPYSQAWREIVFQDWSDYDDWRDKYGPNIARATMRGEVTT